MTTTEGGDGFPRTDQRTYTPDNNKRSTANIGDSTNSGETSSRNYLLLLHVVTTGAILAGVYFRFKGLGYSPFAIDEYYIATSVKSILEHGLPRFHGGGFYDRGILLQYMVAPLFMTGMSHEFAFRLLTVLFNLAALPAVFFLARHIGGIVTACVAVVLFSLSVWEVEFARFARMYAPFGTLFLWHLYFVYRYIMLDDQGALKWVYLFALLSVFVSEFAIFMVLMTFLPLLMRPVRQPFLGYAIPVGLLALTYFYTTTNFRRLGAGDYLPESMMTSSGLSFEPPVHLPPLMLPGVAASQPWLLGFFVVLLLVLVTAALWVREAWRSDGGPRERLLYIIPVGILGLAVLHLHGLAILATIGAFLLAGPSRAELWSTLRQPHVLVTFAAFAATIGYWFAYGVTTHVGQTLLHNTTDDALKDTILLLFNYPSVYLEVVLQWLSAMPVQTSLMAGLIGIGIWQASRRTSVPECGYLLLAAVVVGSCVLVALIEARYTTTRYTYFLYPVVLILVAAAIVRLADSLSMRWWTNGALTAGLLVALMVVSEDFDVRHLWEIDSDRVTYRLDFSPGRTQQYYPRWDFRGAAEYVNERWQDGDTVIVSEYGVPYYVDRMDYFYMDAGDGRFHNISGQQGTRDIWEGARLLFAPEDFLATIAESEATVWLIAKSEQFGWRTEGERIVADRLESYRVYRSVDGHLDVYRITPEVSELVARLADKAGRHKLTDNASSDLRSP